MLIGKVLGKDYKLLQARDGQEALDIATRTAKIDLCLLDVMMPKMDGFELAKKLRELPGKEKLPIVFLTAKDGAMDIVKGIQHGARHYVVKPFKVSDVRSKVKALLTDDE